MPDSTRLEHAKAQLPGEQPPLLQLEPVQLSRLPEPERIAATAGAVLAASAALLLLRPSHWSALGGLQVLTSQVTLPLAVFVLVFLCFVSSAVLMTWSLQRHPSRLAPVGIAALSILAAGICGRLRAAFGPVAEKLIAQQATSTSMATYVAFLFLLLLAGTLAGVVALGVAIAELIRRLRTVGARTSQDSSAAGRRLRQIQFWCVAAAFAIPLTVYVTSLVLLPDAPGYSPPLAAEPTAVSFSGTLAAYFAVSLSGLAFAVGAMAMWQVVAAAQLTYVIGEATAKRLTRMPRLLVPVLALAVAALPILGFNGQLPRYLGGAAEVWRAETTWLLWLLLVLVYIPLVLIFMRHATYDDEPVPPLASAIGIGVLLSSGGLLQALLTLLVHLIPGLSPGDVGLSPGSPFFIDPDLVRAAASLSLCCLAAYLWRRRPALASFLAIVALINAPSVMILLIDLSVPVPHAMHLSVVLSIGLVVGAVVSLKRPDLYPSRPFLLVWAAVTVLAFGQALIPPGVARLVFEVGVVLPLLFSFVLRGGPLNGLPRHRVSEIALMLSFGAFLLASIYFQVRMGDRFGRTDNPAITLWSAFAAQARLGLGLPLLLAFLGPAVMSAQSKASVVAEDKT